MNESDLLANLPAWVKHVGAASGFIAAAAIWLRQYLSAAKVDRTVDEATTKTIERLESQLTAERARADELMHEREAMATEIGQLRGEVVGLRTQVDTLHKQIELLLMLVGGKGAQS